MKQKPITKSTVLPSGIIVTPYNPAPVEKAKAPSEAMSIATAERHMQIIAKWERLHYVTPAKAKALRDRVLEEINR